MNRPALLIAACGMAMACSREAPLAPEPPPALPTYVLIGIVRDGEGLPVPGVVAELAGLSRSDTTDPEGLFSFAEVRGPITLWIQKEGYASHSRSLLLTSDVTISISLVRLFLSDTLVLGQTIRTTVEANAPPCDPIGWDAQAPCRRFTFTAPHSGVLVLMISWIGGSPLDATIIAADGRYVATSKEAGFEAVFADAAVEGGQTYEIRVNSYYGAQLFDLKAVLTP